MPTKNAAAHARLPTTGMPLEEITPVHVVNTCFDMRRDAAVAGSAEADAPDQKLSLRALNVLKMIAGDITGDIPPRNGWVPPEALLRKITMERLSTARNCGPQTLNEIVRWAAARGVTIQPMFHTGKSLTEIWRNLSAKFAAGGLTQAELVEALEKSVRRRTTSVPVTIQRILSQISEQGSPVQVGPLAAGGPVGTDPQKFSGLLWRSSRLDANVAAWEQRIRNAICKRRQASSEEGRIGHAGKARQGGGL